MEEEDIIQHEDDYRKSVEATSMMLDKLSPESPETFYGALVVIFNELFLHAPSFHNAMEIISVAFQNELSEDDFNQYFKKKFKTDPFFAHKNKTLH